MKVPIVPVFVNSATVNELCRVPGIDEQLAKTILRLRCIHGCVTCSLLQSHIPWDIFFRVGEEGWFDYRIVNSTAAVTEESKVSNLKVKVEQRLSSWVQRQSRCDGYRVPVDIASESCVQLSYSPPGSKPLCQLSRDDHSIRSPVPTVL